MASPPPCPASASKRSRCSDPRRSPLTRPGSTGSWSALVWPRYDAVGKVLLLDLDNEQHLLVHPKMTVQLVVVEDGTTVFAGEHPFRSMLQPMPNTTTRVVLSLSAHTMLYFNDQRKFGWIRLVDTDALAGEEFLFRLGREPMSEAFTGRWLREQLVRHRRAPIKAVVLNQSTVAGIGNIYADEPLHLARIDPRRMAGTMTVAEATHLHRAIRTVLRAAVYCRSCDGNVGLEEPCGNSLGHRFRPPPRAASVLAGLQQRGIYQGP